MARFGVVQEMLDLAREFTGKADMLDDMASRLHGRSKGIDWSGNQGREFKVRMAHRAVDVRRIAADMRTHGDRIRQRAAEVERQLDGIVSVRSSVLGLVNRLGYGVLGGMALPSSTSLTSDWHRIARTLRGRGHDL